MKQPALILVLFASRAVLGAEPDLPCEKVNNPDGLSTLCGFAKPEDLQFIRSRSAVIVSEQGWNAPLSGGSISIVNVDTKAVRLGEKRTLWPAASATISGNRVGDSQCKEPPSNFSPHGLSIIERRSSVHLAIVNHGDRESVELFDVPAKAMTCGSRGWVAHSCHLTPLPMMWRSIPTDDCSSRTMRRARATSAR